MLSANAVLQQNRYRIIQPIESSSFNLQVYKAYDEGQKKEVILKEIPEDFFQGSSVKPEKLLELRHEAFQKVLEIFSENGKRYIVMEIVEGDTLSDLIERNKRPFPLSDVSGWVNDLLDALIYLHSHTPALIHQNIKPQNIRLTIDGKVKLDISEIGRIPQAKVGSTITNQNLHFIPFEMIFYQLDPASQKVLLNDYDEKSIEILKQPPDAKSDIYSLGATLYYLLTARLPVDPLERSIEMLEGKPDPLVPPNQLNPKIPSEIAEAIVKAIEIKRENRFDSAAIMRQFLKTAFAKIKERQREQIENISIETNLEDILEIESEPVPVVDLLRKLQEAESKRLEAEKRAAEAEKKLKESVSMRTQDLGVESGILFDEEYASQGMSKQKMMIIGAGVLVFLVVGAGIFTLVSSSAPPQVEKQAQPQIESIETKIPSSAPASQTSEATEKGTRERNQESEIKEARTERQPERQTQDRRNVPTQEQRPVASRREEAQQQQQQQQKKKVTVDDLINDN
ncbi:MAG: protein kinase [Pyrinomonadaceae bacterium]|nr:protein kinase [Pyrinomonadaceae bacterium]